jgi:hypothetical protein
MSKRKTGTGTRHVVPNPEGGWDVVRPGGERASAHTRTKAEALDRGREIVSNQGGGELRIHDRRGRIIDSDTIAPGHESPARDRK